MKRAALTAGALFLAGMLAADVVRAQFAERDGAPQGQRQASNNAVQGNSPYYPRPCSYGNPPYYQRPPAQYYPVPYPFYARPYHPYDAADRGYGYYVVPWGGQPYYMPPRYYYYSPYRY
jgi:hypothetical protein